MFAGLLLLFGDISCVFSQIPIQGDKNHNVYEMTNGNGQKVEWLVDWPNLPASGSFEYRTKPSAQLWNGTYVLRVDDRKTGESITIIEMSNTENETNWLFLDWTLDINRHNTPDCLCLNWSWGGYGGSGTCFATFDAQRNVSIRFDTGEYSPAYIRNVMLEWSPVCGCPPVIPVNNFTATGLSCVEIPEGSITTPQPMKDIADAWSSDDSFSHGDHYKSELEDVMFLRDVFLYYNDFTLQVLWPYLIVDKLVNFVSRMTF